MTNTSRQTAGFSLRTRPLWRIRAVSEGPRYLLSALAVFGLAASARFTFDPPRAGSGSPAASRPAPFDRGAEAFAVLFARRYLTWNAVEPEASARSLEGFVGAGMEPDAGLVLPPSGSEQVEWAEVAQAREPAAGHHVYTIAVQTRPGGLRYVTIGVMRGTSGSLSLSGYPAFVGPPSSSPAELEDHLQPVASRALVVVVRRALANYLTGSSVELAADLTPTAEVSPPSNPLTPLLIETPDWAPGGGAVISEVQAQDASGVHYRLSYELDVERVQGRWEISAVQANPDA